MTQQRGTGVAIIDPRIMRAALADRSAGEPRPAVAARHGISVASLVRWEARSDQETTAGRQWPSDADIRLWDSRRPARQATRRAHTTWRLRYARQGPQRIDATGTARRLQALMSIGWRCSDIGDRLGVSQQQAWRLASQEGTYVLRCTAAAVDAVYGELSMTLGPSDRSRRSAAARGWHPPLAWDDDTIDDPAARPTIGSRRRRAADLDEVAIERAMAGDPVHLTRAERDEAARRLTAGGHSARDVAHRLRITPRSATRLRRDAA